jgi:hypothetical protein
MIFEAFDLQRYAGDRFVADLVKLVDRRMLRTEQRDLMPPAAPDEIRDDVLPFKETIVAGTPSTVRLMFIDRYERLRRALPEWEGR